MTYQARISGIRPVGAHQLLISVDTAGTPLAERYVRVGQYVTLASRESMPGYFSIASAPHDTEMTFLIRVEPDKPKTAPLAALAVGDYLAISEPTGPGYPLEEFHGYDLLLAGTGTGVAPLRALLRCIAGRRQNFGRVFLVYGASDQEGLAFQDEFADWEGAGVELIVTLSRPASDWKGRRGYVTETFAELKLDPARTAAFVCGRPLITEKIAASIRALGVPEERVIQNQ
jgi:NAD(P)H-flavin reductase